MGKKNVSCIWGVIFTLAAIGLLFFAAILQGYSQNVTRKGNVFIQDSSKTKKAKDVPILTKYIYVASDGTKYPIYMSSTGKCFIIRTSSKTGKQYKQYLPEVTKEIQKK
jgi:hypothetical protein